MNAVDGCCVRVYVCRSGYAMLRSVWLLVLETLEVLELSGGPTSTAVLKQYVPSYVSCVPTTA